MVDAPKPLDTLDQAAREKLRLAVMEGYHPPRHPRRPRHRPQKSEVYDRYLLVKDSCRIAAELIGEYGPEAIMAGAEDEGSRSRAEVIIRQAGKHINNLLAFFDKGAGANLRDPTNG